MRVLPLLLFVSLATLAKDAPKYPVSAIPEMLLKNVDAVYRVDDMTFTIVSSEKSTLTIHQVITILNGDGRHHAREAIGYDKLSKVTFYKGVVYDASGLVVRKLKTSEIYDQSAFDGFTLYSDNRFKGIDLSHGSYPYTVEMEYEVEFKSLFQIPDYWVGGGEKTSVEKGQFTVVYPVEHKPRFLETSINQTPVVKQPTSASESLTWTFENVLPIKSEIYGPHASLTTPNIRVAPRKFSYGGYEGTMDTWEQFGQWIALLNAGRSALPETTKQKILALTSSVQDPEEKARMIYEYLQSKTRYVNISLGIGGFQPFEASVVDETGYGDCKALSNYMVSMLDVVGVKANYVLVYAGSNGKPLEESFPSSQFNHAVVCVPLVKDTLWLECTSQSNPFGYMGRFTGNRRALAITETGAQIVTTPTYDETTNVQSRSARVSLTPDGNATAQVATTYSGLQYENDGLDNTLTGLYDKQKEWVQDNTDIPSFNIKSFNMENHKEKIPSAVVNLELTLNRLASVSGKRLFLTPNLMNRSTFIPEKIEQRKTSIHRKMGYTDLDTIRYEVPDNLYPEFLPTSINIESPFGTYDATFTVDKDGLLYVRKVVMKQGEFPADSYGQLIEFYKSINKADNTKIVFLTKT